MANQSLITNPTTIERHKTCGDGDSTINRRRMLTMTTALAVATISPVSMSSKGAKADASLSAMSDFDPEFEAKCVKYREAKAALYRLYAENETKMDKLVEPKFPDELLVPLDLPVRGMKSPDKDGWSKSELATIANGGKWEVFVKSEKAGCMTIKSAFHSVSPETRKRAAELLKLRVAYDSASKRWWSNVKRIEDTTARPVDAMYKAVSVVMKHPVASIADIQRKIQITDDAELFGCYGEAEDDARECIFRDIRAIASSSASVSELELSNV